MVGMGRPPRRSSGAIRLKIDDDWVKQWKTWNAQKRLDPPEQGHPNDAEKRLCAQVEAGSSTMAQQQLLHSFRGNGIK